MDSEIVSYLERELIENRRIVTFRLLSRKFSIHVNVAKNELASFYSHKCENFLSLYATFWLSGIPKSRTTNGTPGDMDVDGDEDNVKDWTARKVVIVDDSGLESAKASFQTIHAFHVYSLSVNPVDNAAQLCRPAREIREMDRAGGEDLARAVGRIRSLQVKGATAGKSKDSKYQAAISQIDSSRNLAKPMAKTKPPQPISSTEKEKPKVTGKLDFINSKVKDSTKNPNDSRISTKVEPGKMLLTDNTEKRGKKRKSDIVQLNEQENTDEKAMGSKLIDVKSKYSGKPTKVAALAARVKKGVILSEDEEEQVAMKARGFGKANKLSDDSDTERSVRAMMDVDDEDIMKMPRPPSSPLSPKGEDEEPPVTDHVDSAMDDGSDDPVPKAKVRQRKTKKAVPIGTNGLRKKRVIKSKTDFDEKGYMVTVDYSSYESVDEEEEEEENDKKKSRARAKAMNVKQKAPKDITFDDTHRIESNNNSTTLKKSESRNNPPKPPVAKGRQSGSSQKSLASFFGPGNGKAKK